MMDILKDTYLTEYLNLKQSVDPKTLLPSYVIELAIEEAILQNRTHRIKLFLEPNNRSFMNVNDLIGWSSTRQGRDEYRSSRDLLWNKRETRLIDEWIKISGREATRLDKTIYDLKQDSIYLF